MDQFTSLNNAIVACDRCPRLREYCREVAAAKRRSYAHDNYWGRPVPNFGAEPGNLLIVGLAPAAHGGNRTGRVFTGDRSGDWLFRALHKAGFANQPQSNAVNDGLKLNRCVITAVCHCAPPDNKPTPEEQRNCRTWLEETTMLVRPRVIVALGQIAFNAIVGHFRRQQVIEGTPRFGHGARHQLLNGVWLLASYHPSQQNTFTGKLSEPMFDEIFTTVNALLSQG